MRKEKLKFTDGTEKEVTIKFLGYLDKQLILNDNFKIGMSGGKESIEKLDIFTIQLEVLKKTIEVEDLNTLQDGEGDKVWAKYFKHILENIGQGN